MAQSPSSSYYSNFIGFGGTGRAMTHRAVAFGIEVLAFDEWPHHPMASKKCEVAIDCKGQVLFD